VPRPNPIDPECFSNGWTLDDYLSPHALRKLLNDNFEWLTHSLRTTREVYAALFRHVDPHGERSREVMEYLNEALSDLGFKTLGTHGHIPNPTWEWVEPS
jgi:hypothetical protein